MLSFKEKTEIGWIQLYRKFIATLEIKRLRIDGLTVQSRILSPTKTLLGESIEGVYDSAIKVFSNNGTYVLSFNLAMPKCKEYAGKYYLAFTDRSIEFGYGVSPKSTESYSFYDMARNAMIRDWHRKIEESPYLKEQYFSMDLDFPKEPTAIKSVKEFIPSLESLSLTIR